MFFKYNGKIVEATSPQPAKTARKDNDKYLYTLSTKNALKLSNYVLEQLKVKIGDKLAYEKYNDVIFLFKATTDDQGGAPLTKLGANKSFVRLNYATLWNELKGDEQSVNKYELGEPVPITDKKGKETGAFAFTLVFVENTPKQVATAKKGKR
ncbi:hypothetical protein [Flavobacterium sp. 3-210]